MKQYLDIIQKACFIIQRKLSLSEYKVVLLPFFSDEEINDYLETVHEVDFNLNNLFQKSQEIYVFIQVLYIYKYTYIHIVHVRQVASVMSDSLQPYGLLPCRLLCPWNSPDKNTGVGCHAFLQIFLTQGLNLCLLHRQAGSLPLALPRKPYIYSILKMLSFYHYPNNSILIYKIKSLSFYKQFLIFD